MIKNNLREQAYSSVEKYPKKSRLNLLWGLLTVFLIGLTFFAVLQVVGESSAEDAFDPFGDFLGYFLSQLPQIVSTTIAFILPLILYLLVYLAIKFVFTILFCRDKNNSIKLTFLNGTAMPVCFCKEAFTVWQTVVIYFVPFAVMYTLVFVQCVLAQASGLYMLIIFFLSFFWAFDLAVTIYVPFVKLTYGIDYISIDHHIYEYTLFNKPYIRLNKKAKKILKKVN